jgi:hypothetical protein
MKAFPSTLEYIPDDRAYEQEDGMDLRDYFAAKAMQALTERVGIREEYTQRARESYKIADEMMKAREL